MTVNAIASPVTQTTQTQVAQTRQPDRQRQVDQRAEQIQAPIPAVLPQSIPSVNTEGQKIGTRISTQA